MRARGRGRGIAALGTVLTTLLLANSPCAFALNPALDVSQYAHTAWKIRDGFFKGYISSIAQTPDGYLWLGTDLGLLRYDGIRWVDWLDRQLPSAWINNVLAARDGTLWIATSKGLASWKDGKLTQYPELAGQFVRRLLEDREGTIWTGAGSLEAGRLCAIWKGSAQCYGEDGRFGTAVLGLYEDSHGNLWAGATTGLWRWKPGTPKLYPSTDRLDGVQSMIEGDNGALWIAVGGGIRQLVEGKIEPYPIPAAGQFTPERLLRDHEGGLWIGTLNRGLVHLHQGRADVFAPSDGLSGEFVYSVFEDREGNIWVATNGGLDRFREFAVATFSVNQGLSSGTSVLAARDGSLWRGHFGRLEPMESRPGYSVQPGRHARGKRDTHHRGQWIAETQSGGSLSGPPRANLGLEPWRARIPGEWPMDSHPRRSRQTRVFLCRGHSGESVGLRPGSRYLTFVSR
jgi:ligand-binding sensor domain-containing protein